MSRSTRSQHLNVLWCVDCLPGYIQRLNRYQWSSIELHSLHQLTQTRLSMGQEDMFRRRITWTSSHFTIFETAQVPMGRKDIL
jgi:hypothetical protein